MRTALTVITLAGLLLVAPARAQGEKPPTKPGHGDPRHTVPNPARADAKKLAPPISGAKLRARAIETYRRGFAYLLETQNKDGSWGSHHPKLTNLKNFGFGTGNRGSQDAVRFGCTALVGKALMRKKDRTPAENASYEKAADVLVTKAKIPYQPGEAFNTWGYGFKLSFLVDYLKTDAGKKRAEAVRAAIRSCVVGLKRYQLVDGGWNYYAGPLMGGTSMSFNTANFAADLHRASKLGVPVPKGLYEDPKKLLLRMRTRRGGFVYDARYLKSANAVNELSAGARTAACTEALVELGALGKPEMMRSLELFNEGENWLEQGRKLIRPHSAVHQISGYFFFYGYYYLGEFSQKLGDAVPASRWERTAWTMIRTQEKDGGWWDTPAADYGDKWGTAFALLCLQHYFDAVPENEGEQR